MDEKNENTECQMKQNPSHPNVSHLFSHSILRAIMGAMLRITAKSPGIFWTF